MARFQVIVSKDSRSWDSIRELDRLALYRVGQHMMLSDSPSISTDGKNITTDLAFGLGVNDVVRMLNFIGYKVTIKQLDSVNIVEGVV